MFKRKDGQISASDSKMSRVSRGDDSDKTLYVGIRAEKKILLVKLITSDLCAFFPNVICVTLHCLHCLQHCTDFFFFTETDTEMNYFISVKTVGPEGWAMKQLHGGRS